MRKYNFLSSFLTIATILVGGTNVSNAQLIANEVFLQGTYVEVGIATNGSFGTDNNAPAGYHARDGSGGTRLGFVADVGKDGWTAGSPAYIGDYFLPGSPQEGWDMQVGTNRALAWRGSGGTSFTGGLTGVNTSYATTATSVVGVWEGTLDSLAITQTTTLKKDKRYFVMNVKIRNTSSKTIKDIYYNRTVDPDNEVPTGGSFVTNNKITFKLPNPDNKTLVTGVGLLGSFLGLGTKDCRAIPYIVDAGLQPNDSLHKVWNGTGQGSTGYIYKLDSLYSNDVGIGVVFKIDSLKKGDSTLLSYAYVLSTEDLDSAFQDLTVSFSVNGKNFTSGDTVKACIGSKLDVSVINVGTSQLHWGPNVGLRDTTGTDNQITVGSSTITYTITSSGSYCAVPPTYITVVPVPLPAGPAAPSPVYYCQHDVPVALKATGVTGAVIKWYTAAVGGTSTLSLIPPTNAVGSVTYYVSQLYDICESERTPVTVVTRPLPTIDSVKWVSPSKCGVADGYFEFTTTPDDTFTVYYERNTIPQAPRNFVTDATGKIRIKDLGPGDYSAVYLVNQFGCTSVTYYGLIPLKDPSAVTPVVSNNGPICVGQVASLSSSFIDSSIYTWTGPDGFVSNLQNPTFVVTTASAGTYTLTIDRNKCISSASTTVAIKPAPEHQTFQRQQILCEDKDLRVDLRKDLDVDYQWNGPAGFILFDSNLSVKNIQQSEAGEYILTASNGVGCVTLDTVVVKVDKNIELSFGGDTSICVGDAASIFAFSTGPRILWSPGITLSDSTASNVVATPAQTTTYAITAFSGNTCANKTGNVMVEVLPLPAITGYDTLVRMGVGYTLTPQYEQTITKWLWMPADSLSCFDCPNPVFMSSRSIEYVVRVSTEKGCTSEAKVKVDVFCDGSSVTMPNAFTPNGDGNNDIFYVRGHGFMVKKFAVYNRYGQEVFSKEGEFRPNDPQYGWDGTFNGTTISDPSGYVYMIHVQCLNSTNEPIVIKGSFLLVK